MTINNRTFQVPPGVKDLLPKEAKEKRALEEKFARILAQWGYEEVVTPAFEYERSLTVDSGETVINQLYRFFDRDGKILALRPDMTTPIARLVATRLQDEQLPLRLFYLANVFRYEEPQAGRQREFYQAGVEFIGDNSPYADGEVIALAVKCLKEAGLNNFQLAVGQVQLINGLMAELNLSGEDKKQIHLLTSKKDLVGLEELVQSLNLSSENQDRIMNLSQFHGQEDILQKAGKFNVNSQTDKALNNLFQVFQVIKAYGVEDKVFIDLGVLRGLDYYTGIVFEGYTAGLGFPICGGGRYDNLLGKFGYPQPATGFAVGLERIFLALAREANKTAAELSRYLVKGNNLPGVLAKAESLRNEGSQVETDLSQRNQAETEDYCLAKGITLVEV